jgi:plastocyanin
MLPHSNVGQAAAMMSLFGMGFPHNSPFGMLANPMLAGSYGRGGYAMPSQAGYGMMPSQGSGYGTMSGSRAGNQYANTQQLTTASKPINALDHLRKHGGGLDWPLGLRVLEPTEDTKELRQEIDDAVDTMFRQPGGTDTTPKLLKQVSDQLDKLDRRYKGQVWDMALTRQQEADVRRFLDKVHDALMAAEDSATLYAQSQLYSESGHKGREHGPREVGAYDNHFEPKSIEIAAGGKVRWKNHGKHEHTITADNGEWLSLDLPRGSEITVTFTNPGTYYYHCSIHPNEMRGTIIVK